MYEQTDDQAVNYGYSSCFCRCEDTAVDTAQDDNGGQQCPFTSPYFAERTTDAERFCVAFITSFSCIDVAVNDQYQTDEDTGDEARQEQGAYGAVYSYGVNNHRDTGRDDNADGTSGSDQRQYEFFVIAFFQHGRNNHTADSCYSCRTGTGNSREEHTYNNGYDGKTAADSAEEYVGNVQQTF